jgi:MFS family permease
MNKNLTSAEEIKSIKKIMEESSRFLSLSGLSGVFAGLFAILGAIVAYFLILSNGSIHYDEYFRSLSEKETIVLRWQLFFDAAAVLVFSVLLSFWFSYKKAKHSGKRFWTPVSKKMLINLFIPLATGGIFILVLLIRNYIQLVVPGFLIFYGLGLINAGKFTYDEIFYLGLLEIITGLISSVFPGFGIFFWIFGFGFLHIIYGVFMYRKYGA